MHCGRALKGGVGAEWMLQIATVIVAFALTMGAVGTLIYSVDQTQREVDSAVVAYRLAATLNILRTVDGGEAERKFTSPLTIRLEGRQVIIADAGGKERGLEYLVGATQQAVGGGYKVLPIVAQKSYCVKKPLGGDLEVKPCPEE